jgi:flagellar motor component MotA
MKLNDRLNVLIQATILSQKNGVLSLDEAVKAKSAIDTISSGLLNQNFTSAINFLIEIAISSQKKGIYSLKDSHMIYIAVEGIEKELNNEFDNISDGAVREVVDKT